MEQLGLGQDVDREALEKSQARSEKLLEELKEAVQADARDAGLLRKELTVTVPAQVIADHLQLNYDELMHDALVPGFRKGRAPRRLVEKRFGADVRESLKAMIVGQSFYAAADKLKLDPLGDPLFRIDADGGSKLVAIGEALEKLALPESGDFSYACEVELRPQFELPTLTGIPVRDAEIVVTDEMAAEEVLKRRKVAGRFEPVEGPATEPEDQITADVTLRVDDQTIKTEENVVLGVRAARLDGIPIFNLDEVLKEVRAGDAREAEVTIPDDYERTDLRGKPARFGFQIHEVKRLVPQELAAFLESWSFDSELDAIDHFKQAIESERDRLVARTRRTQVERYLLENTQLDLPESFSARQVDRAVMRKVVALHQRGVPATDIESRIDELRTSAADEVRDELKLAFIFGKIAEEREVEVTDEELNAEVARIARAYDRRFDRVRDDLQARGLLDELVEEIRQSRCVDLLLADADLKPAGSDEPPAGEPQ